MYKSSIMFVLALLASGCSWFSSEPTRVENPVIKGINYIGITVSDLSASSDLYMTGADLKLVHEKVLSDAPILQALSSDPSLVAKTRLLRGVNGQLNIMEFNRTLGDKPVAVQGPGIAHVCYQVDQTTQSYQKFLAAGAQHIGDPQLVQISSKRPVYYGYAKDTDGISFEVEHVDVQALNLPEPPKNKYRIRQVALSTPDIDKLVAFYSVLLETSNPRRAGQLMNLSGEKLDKISGLPGSEIEMAWFQVRNLELEIIQYHSHPTQRPEQPRPLNSLGYNSIVFDVTDLQAARVKLLEAGGKVVVEPTSWEQGEIMYGRDIDGNLLGFQVVDGSSAYSAENFKNNGL